MHRLGFILAILILSLSVGKVHAQDSLGLFEPSPTLNKKRLKGVVITETAGYGLTMAGLYQVWYKDYWGSGFHMFNDNDEWLQVDKVGHAMTSYYVGLAGKDVLEWSGVNKKKALIYGGGLGLFFQTSLEVFDGFSNGWGFSTGDMIANASGTALLVGQELAWQEQRIKFKFSIHRTDFANYRPEVLGSTFSERFFKDYNGQTYWLSANISSFLNSSSKFPKWLNFAVGYGADGMTGGSRNYFVNNAGETIPAFERRRQYYLALDIDLSRIPTKSGFLKTVFKTFGFLKIPAPTLEFNAGGVTKLRPFYF